MPYYDIADEVDESESNFKFNYKPECELLWNKYYENWFNFYLRFEIIEIETYVTFVYEDVKCIKNEIIGEYEIYHSDSYDVNLWDVYVMWKYAKH